MDCKYVVFDKCHVVCFSGALTHSEVKVVGLEPTSAGFFRISSEVEYYTELGEHWPEGRTVTSVHTYGEAVSLGLSSTDKDANLIRIALGL